MDWDDLKVFAAVARKPRLDDASMLLRQDPTTISRKIRRLESNLNQTLFHRTRRGHQLTPDGEALLAKVSEIEDLVLNAQEQARGAYDVAGQIRIGATEGLAAAVIAPAVGKFAEAHPGVDIDLISLSGFANVSRREVDMSIMLTRPRTGRLKVRKLADYDLHLYASKRYLSQNAEISDPSSLKDHTLIGYVDDLIYSPKLRYFDEVLPGLDHRLSSPSILSQLELTRAGAGLCILPKFLASSYSELSRVLADEIVVHRSFWLSTHQDTHAFERNRLFVEHLSETIAAQKHIFV